MAAYTSSGNGNWNDPATWGGGGYPQSGDTATIRAQDTVTITANAVVGTGGATGTDQLIITGILQMAGAYSLTVRGDVHIDGSLLFVSPGNSIIVADGNYDFELDNNAIVRIKGSSTNRASFSANASYSTAFYQHGVVSHVCTVEFQYCDFTRLGNGTRPGWVWGNGAVTSSVIVDNCKFDTYQKLRYGVGTVPNADSVYWITNCTFVNSLDHSYVLEYGCHGAFNAGTRKISLNCFKGSAAGGGPFGPDSIWMSCDLANDNPFLFEDNILIDVQFYHSQGSKIKISIAQTWVNYSPPSGCNQIICGAKRNNSEIYDTVLYSKHVNPHPVSISSGTNVDDNESLAHDNVVICISTANDSGDLLCYNNGKGRFYKNITIGGTATGILVVGTASQTVVTDRHTHVTLSDYSGINSDSIFNFETNVFTGQATLRNSLIIGCNAVGDKLVNNHNAGAVTMAYTDYNVMHGCGVLFANRYSNIAVSGKNLGDAGFGGSDKVADPKVNGSNFGTLIEQWDTSLGGAGTVANAFAEMFKIRGFTTAGAAGAFNSAYTRDNLLTFIRRALTPHSKALKGAGMNGADIGAVDVKLTNSVANRISMDTGCSL